MPTYDYTCDACGNGWELFQQMTADPVKECPKCGKKKARRLIGAGAGIVFKGSGFYETDYRSSSYKDGEKKAKESAKPADKAAGSSETKTGDAATGDAKTGGGSDASTGPKPKSTD